MSKSVSSSIFIQAIEDGTTIHGNLVATDILSQAYSGGSFMPDWTIEDEQPTIYLSLLEGTDEVANSINPNRVTWTYNDAVIQFGANGIDTNFGGVFMRTTWTNSAVSGERKTVPALRIVGNLAGEYNNDNDVIGCVAEYEHNGSAIPFTLFISVRITEVSSNGYFGVIGAATQSGNSWISEGDAVLDADTREITLYGRLWASGSEVSYDRCFVKWYVGVTEKSVSSISMNGRNYHAVHLTDSDITDYGVVECKFYADKSYQEFLCSAIIEINDTLDDEMMYVKSTHSVDGDTTSESGEGNRAYLRKKQSVTYDVWIAKNSDERAVYTEYKHYYVLFRDNQNNRVVKSLGGIPDVISVQSEEDVRYGYRTMYVNSSTTPSIPASHGQFTVSFDNLVNMGKSITGYLLASTSPIV